VPKGIDSREQQRHDTNEGSVILHRDFQKLPNRHLLRRTPISKTDDRNARTGEAAGKSVYPLAVFDAADRARIHMIEVEGA
jgi:hypothetical protein